MDASTLPIPQGVMAVTFVDDVREVVTYDVASDGVLARWDTKINGHQFHVMEYQVAWEGRYSVPEDKTKPSYEYWLDVARVEAIAKLKAIDKHSNQA